MCRGCGTRLEEWDETAGGDDFAYEVEIKRCRGCESIEDARSEIPEGANTKGLQFALVPSWAIPEEDDEE